MSLKEVDAGAGMNGRAHIHMCRCEKDTFGWSSYAKILRDSKTLKSLCR